MTKEEFYNLAQHKPEIMAKSIYKLTIRNYRDDIKRYRKTPNKQEWSYPIYKSTWFFSSKSNAEKAVLKYIESPFSPIHSFLIERITMDTDIKDTEHLEWWSYNSKGKQIMGSLCTSSIPEFDQLTIDNIFLGRPEDSYPFKMGDIVEIISGDRAYLEILNGLPLSVNECWERYEEKTKKRGPKPEGPYYNCDYFADCMADQFFYLQEDGFDPDVPPYVVMKPTFPVPEKVKETLTSRYNRWKEYVDSHSYEEINWEELQSLVRGKN